MPSVHTTTVEDRIETALDNFGEVYVTAASRYRWKCSCGRAGPWSARRYVVERAGELHSLRPGTRGCR